MQSWFTIPFKYSQKPFTKEWSGWHSSGRFSFLNCCHASDVFGSYFYHFLTTRACTPALTKSYKHLNTFCHSMSSYLAYSKKKLNVPVVLTHSFLDSPHQAWGMLAPKHGKSHLKNPRQVHRLGFATPADSRFPRAISIYTTTQTREMQQERPRGTELSADTPRGSWERCPCLLPRWSASAARAHRRMFSTSSGCGGATAVVLRKSRP